MRFNILIPVDGNIPRSTFCRSLSSLKDNESAIVALHISLPRRMNYLSAKDIMDTVDSVVGCNSLIEVRFYRCMEDSPDRRAQVISFLESNRITKEDYVMFMDADDELNPGFFRYFVDHIHIGRNPTGVVLNCLRKNLKNDQITEKPYMNYLNANLDTYLDGDLANVPWGMAIRCDVFEEIFIDYVYGPKEKSVGFYGDEFHIQNRLYSKVLSKDYVIALDCVYLWCYEPGRSTLSMKNLTPEKVIQDIREARAGTYDILGASKSKIVGINTMRSALKMIKKSSEYYKYIWEKVFESLDEFVTDCPELYPPGGDLIDAEVFSLLYYNGYKPNTSRVERTYNSLEEYFEEKSKDNR